MKEFPSNPLPACPNTPNCYRDFIETEIKEKDWKKAASSILHKMKAHEIEVSPNNHKIETVFKIPIFGWLDDFVLLYQEGENKSYIFFRSASRVGYSDLGVNKRRVESFKRLFNKKYNSNS